MQKKFYCILLSCLLTNGAWAQQKKISPALGSAFIGFTYLEPLGDFRETAPTLKSMGGMAGVLINLSSIKKMVKK